MENYRRDSVTIEFDPMCDKENPQKISFEDVSAAAFRIQSGIVKTPCVKSHMSALYGMDIYLKNDFLQHTGSFKERGARNALLLLPKDSKDKGAITASLGNHSQAISYHGFLLDIPTTVVMPNVAPIMKIEKCRSCGANVIIHGDSMKEAKFHAMMLAKERNLVYINGYDHPHIMAGQGTIGLEILEQVPDVDAILVPVGGGGLLAGVATAVKHLKPHDLIYITVNEDWLARATLRLIEQEKYVVEGGGAVGVAAIMAGLVPELAAKNFDHPNIIEGHGTLGIEIIEQLPTVDAVLVPVGGGGMLAGVAIAIKHLKPDTEVYVKVVCETRGPAHMEELRELIAHTYKEWYFAGDRDDYIRKNSLDTLDEEDISH